MFDEPPEPEAALAPLAPPQNSTHANTGGQPAAEKILALLEARGKRMLLSALDHAYSIGVEGDSLCISYSPSGTVFKNQLEARDNRKSLEEVSREVMGRPIALSVSLGRQSPGSPASPAEARKQEAVDATEQAQKHPAVRSLMDTFHGEVIEVIKPE